MRVKFGTAEHPNYWVLWQRRSLWAFDLDPHHHTDGVGNRLPYEPPLIWRICLGPLDIRKYDLRKWKEKRQEEEALCRS